MQITAVDRTILGMVSHDRAELVVGHAKSSPDWCFGLFKQAFHTPCNQAGYRSRNGETKQKWNETEMKRNDNPFQFHSLVHVCERDCLVFLTTPCLFWSYDVKLLVILRSGAFVVENRGPELEKDCFDHSLSPFLIQSHLMMRLLTFALATKLLMTR